MRIGSRVKSCVDAGVFSHTMSRCPWITTAGAASAPGVAGTVISRLPARSRRLAKFFARAQASNQRAMASSFFEQRGMRLISSKISRSRRVLAFMTVALQSDAAKNRQRVAASSAV